LTSSYAYLWTGAGIGTGVQTDNTLAIASLNAQVDAACTVTGSATYPVVLNTNGGTINSGNITAYTYGAGAACPKT
jgi:hypothetical protein